MPATKPTLAERVVTAMLAKDRATPMLGTVVLSADEGTCSGQSKAADNRSVSWEPAVSTAFSSKTETLNLQRSS